MVKTLPSLARIGLQALLVSAFGLAATASAAGPPKTALAFVGAGGATHTFHGARFSAPNITGSQTAIRPVGPSFLLFWIHDGAWMEEPARFFPDQNIVCFAFDLSTFDSCSSVRDEAAARFASTGLNPRPSAPTVVRRLVTHGRILAGSVPITYAFSRRSSGRSTPKPIGCISARAEWMGPEASDRPKRLCLTRGGVWSHGRLYSAPGVLRSL